MFVHLVEQKLLLSLALFAGGQQMRFVAFFDFVVDSPNGRFETSLFCKEFHDIEFMELLLTSKVLEYTVSAQYCAMFAIVVEFGENRPVFLKIHNRLLRRMETLGQRRAIEQSVMRSNVVLVGRDFIGREDFQFRRTIRISEKRKVIPKSSAVGRCRFRSWRFDACGSTQPFEQ